MIYSHFHGDHYLGAQGVLPPDQDMSIQIITPEGFMEAVMGESILAGPAMRKRGCLHVRQRTFTGTWWPNRRRPGYGLKWEHVVDGIRIVFQMVPGTEAPAKIPFYFLAFRALCVAEMATNYMHNIVTLRGAQVRDAKAWSGH
ncbi:putative Metallo-beta-lactamase domain-containing protein [Seiridium cardinale]